MKKIKKIENKFYLKFVSPTLISKIVLDGLILGRGRKIL